MTMMEDIANLRDQVIHLSFYIMIILEAKYLYFNYSILR